MNLDNITSYALNLKGWHTSKKIIVIHSDDWGSIRMPSNKAREKLQSHQEIKETNAYAKYDTLASTSDLEALFEVLHSVKDKPKSCIALCTRHCPLSFPEETSTPAATHALNPIDTAEGC